MNVDGPVWASTFSFNRDRLLDEEMAQRFFEHTVLLARVGELVSDEHFSVGGTLLEVWASHRSFRPKDGGGGGNGGDFRGERRSAIDGRAADSKGYLASIKVRKRIEHSFGWAKTVGALRKQPRIGLAKVDAWVRWNFAAYKLIRIGGVGE